MQGRLKVVGHQHTAKEWLCVSSMPVWAKDKAAVCGGWYADLLTKQVAHTGVF